jgi:3-oxoacyl-[acyl-carrier protein] reductase
MDLGIRGRKAIIAGGSAGLGAASALALAREGVEITVSARGEERLKAFASDLERQTHVRVTAVAADHGTPGGRQALLAACPEPDIMVITCSPPGVTDNLSAITEAQWLAALTTTLLGPIELMRASLDGMAERGFGRVVNIATVAAKFPWDKRVLSGAPRSALINYAQVVAKRYADRNVTVNSLLPGMFRTSGSEGRSDEELAATARKMRIPAGRFGRPEELASLCATLCGANAGFITGQSLVIDGGATNSLF